MSLNKDEPIDSERDKNPKPFFKKGEAYVLSVFIVLITLPLEISILFSDSSVGSTGKLLVVLPVLTVLLIKSILKNSEK